MRVWWPTLEPGSALRAGVRTSTHRISSTASQSRVPEPPRGPPLSNFSSLRTHRTRGVLYNPRRAQRLARADSLRVPMNLADYLGLLAVLLSAVIGAVRGFLREAVAVVTLILAIFLAWTFADRLAPHLGGLLKSEPVATWAARALIFFLVVLVGMAVAALLFHFVRLSLFSGTDRFLGFLFGLLRGV